MAQEKIKLLIVDDSPTIHKILCKVFGSESDFEVVGLSSNPFEAIKFLEAKQIDVIILDLEMPKMDGMTFLQKITSVFRGQIIVMSTVVHDKPAIREKLISMGAYECFAKPDPKDPDFFPRLNACIRRAYSQIKLKPTANAKRSADAHRGILLIAASTGGTEGVRSILKEFTESPPATVVIQHMSAQFTKTFAQSLQTSVQFEVKEADEGDEVLEGRVLIAPGDFHVNLVQRSGSLFVTLNKDPQMHGVRPAADPTFFSVPDAIAKHSTVVVLSGMGKDGAEGVRFLKKRGSEVFVEAESSCVVFGMPKAAIDTGCVDHVLDIKELGPALSAKFLKKAA